LCRECFTEGSFPKVLTAFDFEKQSLETALKSANFGVVVQQRRLKDEDEEEEEETAFWTLEDKQRLIDAVALHGSDWETVSDKAFDGGFTALECVNQFLSLPISESLLLRFQTASVQNQGPTTRQPPMMQTYIPTVFQDLSNPLLSQLAIFAKSLEYLESHD
jgi:Myb-like DNA-binding domain